MAAKGSNEITITVSDVALKGLNILLARENKQLNSADALPITLEELLSVSTERQGVAEFVRDGRANKADILAAVEQASEADIIAIRQALGK